MFAINNNASGPTTNKTNNTNNSNNSNNNNSNGKSKQPTTIEQRRGPNNYFVGPLINVGEFGRYMASLLEKQVERPPSYEPIELGFADVRALSRYEIVEAQIQEGLEQLKRDQVIIERELKRKKEQENAQQQATKKRAGADSTSDTSSKTLGVTIPLNSALSEKMRTVLNKTQLTSGEQNTSATTPASSTTTTTTTTTTATTQTSTITPVAEQSTTPPQQANSSAANATTPGESAVLTSPVHVDLSAVSHTVAATPSSSSSSAVNVVTQPGVAPSAASSTTTATSTTTTATTATPTITTTSSTTTINTLKLPALPRGEVVLTVSLYHAARKQRLMDVEVLGTQTLAHLVDRFDCPASHSALALPNNHNQLMYIEGVFYDDVRHENAVRYSTELIKWLNAVGERMPTHLDAYVAQDGLVRNMHETPLNALLVRPHAPYLWLHQGDCEHVFIITQIRAARTIDAAAGLTAYPKVMNVVHTRQRKCRICDIYPAKYVTRNDRLAPETPCLFCTRCYQPLHYTENNTLIENFAEFAGAEYVPE